MKYCIAHSLFMYSPEKINVVLASSGDMVKMQNH